MHLSDLPNPEVEFAVQHNIDASTVPGRRIIISHLNVESYNAQSFISITSPITLIYSRIKDDNLQ